MTDVDTTMAGDTVAARAFYAAGPGGLRGASAGCGSA